MNKIPETALCKLALKYKTDKCPKRGKYTYTPYYYNLFKDKKRRIKKVLEIGIGKGASLYMWRDFFPKAKIYGVDYRKDLLINKGRIKSFHCDQRKSHHLKNLIDIIGTDIDLVVDDGSHRPRDQVFTCLTLMPLLKKGVIYIIEDVADPSIVDKLNQYDAEVPSTRQLIRRHDNKLVIVRHKKKPVKITFFAKKPNRTRPDGHLQRVSSIIRGFQPAEFIGAKINPKEGYKNDVCIYVKPPYKQGDDFIFEGKAYLDVVDERGYHNLLKKHPEVGVISLSDWNYKLLKKTLPNKIVNIPQQHCNFEGLRRTRTQVTTVGVIGTLPALRYLPKGLKEELKKRGMKLLVLSKFFTRQDIVDFYMSIDVQIVWRPFYDYKKEILVNPLKIVNSASFGIPTICYDEKAFKEMRGCYIGVRTLKEFLFQLDILRSNPKLYDQYAKRCLTKAKKYHIKKIAQLYKNLAI
jgi:hypothetical protein